MPTDSSLEALRDASPRNQPGFEESIARYDALRRQITATPVPSPAPLHTQPASRRRLIGLSVAAAATLALVGVIVSLTVSATSPPSAFAAARKALAVTASAVSGTMTMTESGSGVRTPMLETTRWNGDDIALSSGGVNHIIGPNRQLLLAAGGAYVQTADGHWLHYASETNVGPKLGPAVQLAHDNVAGNTAQQILDFTSGLQKAAGPGGTTVYTGMIPNSTADLAGNPNDDALLRMVSDLRTGFNPGAPDGSHIRRYVDNLQLKMTVASNGMVTQISLTREKPATGSSAQGGPTTWSVTYSRLGTTPPITAPANSTPTTPRKWSPYPLPPNGPHGG